MVFPAMNKSMVLLAAMLLFLSTASRNGSSAYAQEVASDATVNAKSNSNSNEMGNESKPDNKFDTKELFRSLDVNHDSSFDLKDFYKIDANKDAQISMAEFESVVGYSSPTGDDDDTGGFVKGFTSSTAMIIATEIGDKTFFIAAVLSMRHSRLTIFCGAILALICMTVLSTMMGLILPSLLPRQYTHIIGGLLFLYFGIKLIYDSRSMSDKVSDELEEVEEELGCNNKKNEEQSGDNENEEKSSVSVHMGHDNNVKSKGDGKSIFFQAFLLTFLAEWGDRSQIATIALAAAKDPFGVTLGGCFGHSLCTGMAVVGGRMLASRISEKTVTFWGGVIFLGFGIHAFVFDL